MSLEFKQTPQFTIELMTSADVQPANEMRLESWLDTYVNDGLGVTKEWLQERNKDQNSSDKNERRRKRLTDPSHAAWVAKDGSGEIVGLATPYKDDMGIQHVGSMYVSRSWQGKGVGAALMQKVIDWSDSKQSIELHVVEYNERAIAFYQKWGFEKVDGYMEFLDDKIPEIMMTRKGDKQ